jgi:hypothetical protein
MIPNKMLLILLLPLVNGLLLGRIHYDDLWALFPRKQSWPVIMQSFKDKEQINPYLTNYITPFRQLQKAVRDDSVSPDVIRASLRSLINAYQSTLDMYIISEESFGSMKDILDLSSPARQVTAPLLKDPVLAQMISPVFTVEAVLGWLRQRLEDMVIGSKSHDDYLEDRANFQEALSAWSDHIPAMSGSELKHVVRVTEDIEEVEKRVGGYIASYLQSVKQAPADSDSSKNDRDVIWKVSMLGNVARTLKATSIYWVCALCMVTSIMLI